jgi:hypothetical protein
MLDVSMILKLVDKFTGPARNAKGQANALAGSGGLGGLAKGGASAASGMSLAERGVGRLGSMLARAKGAIGSFAQKSLPMLERAAHGAGRGIGSLLRKGAGLAASAAGWAAAGASAGAGFFIGGIVKTAAQFEQMEAQIGRLEGSAAKGKAAMDWISKFATETPFELGEVTDAFVRARGVGIDPMTGALRIMGDAASANRKTVMDSIEAIADAQTGEFERLKEFNITSASKGAMVTFSYIDKQGKAASKSVRKSAIDVRQALLSIWDDRHGGEMINQSRTLVGIWSNMKDWVTRFQLQIAKAGFFDALKTRMEGFQAKLNAMAEDGRLKAWADRISAGLEDMTNRAFDFINNTDWSAVVRSMGEIVSTLGTIINLIGQAAGAWNSWQRNLKMTELQTMSLTPSFFPEWLGGGAVKEKSLQQLEGMRREDIRAKFETGKTDETRRSKGMRALPRAGAKTSALDVNNKLHVVISAPPGVSATARPLQTAANTSLTLSRKKLGAAMPGLSG